jgi:uncharacterized protein YjeT (DUF2065 family)
MNTMKRTHLSLYYLFSYLILAGVALLIAPQTALDLMLATGSYGDVMPRLLGVMLLALGLVILQIVRHQVDALYSTTLVVRSIILVCLAGLYVLSRDPLFLMLIGVVGLGFVLTGVSYWLDRRGATS